MINIFRHNFGMKIIALLLAITAWGFTRISDPIEEVEIMFDIDVRLSEGSSLVYMIPPTGSVTAYVRGPVSRLERLGASGIKVVLDGRDIPFGESKTVHPRLERRFAGVDVEFAPNDFELTVDRTTRMEFTPEEVGEGVLLPGYFIEERIGLPPAIIVAGASSLVEKVDRVVYRVNYSEMSGSTELTVEFTPVDEEGHDVPNLTITPATADLGISLRPSLALKTVPIVPDYQGNPATNYALTSVSIDPFLVELSGTAEALEGVQSVRTAPINLTGKTSSFQTSVSLLEPGEGVGLSISRATVQVEIEQLDTSFTFEDLLIDQRNTDVMYSYELSTQRVDVTIRGAPDRIANVSSDLIRPQVHLGGLGPGTHEVQVSVALPSEVRSDRISPSSVTVTVTQIAVPIEEPPSETPPDDGGDTDPEEGPPEEPEASPPSED